MTTPKKHSSPMPDILWCIDNDFEQRYYRSPETLATAIHDGYYRPPNDPFPSRLVTYVRADGDHPYALDPAPLMAIVNLDRPERERLWDAAGRGFQAAGKKVPALEKAFKAWEKQTREKLIEAIRKTLP